jgi:2-polyprenyl-3-methyl-5-hydroxy-6-metoxy-1,4-benzoquinol methylase
LTNSERYEKNYEPVLQTCQTVIRFCIEDEFLNTETFAQAKPQIDYKNIKNILPNSGNIKTTKNYVSAEEIIIQFRDGENRKQEISGFEGFAPDDAIFDAENQSYEKWSYLNLASILAYLSLKKYPDPMFLELGCGASHLFGFLHSYGINNYIGIDGNPYFIDFNPYLKGYEEHFMIQNLQEEIKLQSLDGQNILFDVILSFEVMEHIREDKIDNLLKTILNHMHQKSILICTASLQELDVHILVRERKWWLKLFENFGLFPIKNDSLLIEVIGKCHPFNWKPTDTNIFIMELKN